MESTQEDGGNQSPSLDDDDDVGVFLCQEPPGTGKTHVLATLVNILYNTDCVNWFFICAKTNKALDNILEKLTGDNFALKGGGTLDEERMRPQMYQLGYNTEKMSETAKNSGPGYWRKSSTKRK